ncbi:hypothetical protein niasHT_036124 [Heterodera trifolii]|uniref:Uncharacterized protein n=1 Tax=Heterodera trifolii TaxID=157864 RepID=A0ABD2I4J2_9BILA
MCRVKGIYTFLDIDTPRRTTTTTSSAATGRIGLVIGSAFDGQRRGQGVQQLSSIPTHSEDDFFTGWIPSMAMNGDGVIFRHRRRECRPCHVFINS